MQFVNLWVDYFLRLDLPLFLGSEIPLLLLGQAYPSWEVVVFSMLSLVISAPVQQQSGEWGKKWQSNL